MTFHPRHKPGGSATLDEPISMHRELERGPATAAPEHRRSLGILSFNYEYPPVGGGGGVFHELLAEDLAKRHRVAVITSAFGDLPAHEVRAGVHIHRVPVLGRSDPSAASLLSMLTFPPAAWLAAARLLRRERYDLVHSHFAVPTGPGSLPPAMLARIPHVLTIQGGDIYDPSKRLSPHRNAFLRAAVTQILRCSTSVVAASRNIVENTYRYFSYRGPIVTVPLGIRRPPAVETASRASLALPEGVFLTVTVGRLVRRKGLDRLLHAIAHPGCAAVHLAVLGSGPELEPLQALARSLSISDRVHFLGRVEEKRKWQILKIADAYVSASLHEGFGLVYLEAMASGLPVVTTDHGGQADFLEDGETGYLVKAGDARGLVDALARAVGSREDLKRMGAANLIRAPKYFIERCTEAYERLFYRILDPVEKPARSSASRGRAKSSGVFGMFLAPEEWLARAAELAPLLAL